MLSLEVCVVSSGYKEWEEGGDVEGGNSFAMRARCGLGCGSSSASLGSCMQIITLDDESHIHYGQQSCTQIQSMENPNRNQQYYLQTCKMRLTQLTLYAHACIDLHRMSNIVHMVCAYAYNCIYVLLQ